MLQLGEHTLQVNIAQARNNTIGTEEVVEVHGCFGAGEDFEVGEVSGITLFDQRTGCPIKAGGILQTSNDTFFCELQIRSSETVTCTDTGIWYR